MKKTLTLFAVCFFTLFCGIIFSACEESGNKFIDIRLDKNFVQTVVEVDGQSKSANDDGRFEVPYEHNVKIKFYASQHGVDLSNLSVKADGVEKVIQKNGTNFDSLHSDGDLYFGYINFPLIQKDVVVEVSGADSYKSYFTFVGQNLEDQKTLERLDITSISFDNINFTNFKEFLTSGQTTIVYDLLNDNENLDRKFYLKFDGTNPYYFAETSPLKIAKDNEEQQSIPVPQPTDGVYAIDLADFSTKDTYKIFVDFKDLSCQQFDVEFPQENQTFSFDKQQLTLNYESSATISLNTLLPEDQATYDVQVFLNDLQLQKTEDENSQTYIIPEHLTPAKTGNESGYLLKVKGVEYVGKTSFVVKVDSTEHFQTHRLVQPKIVGIDADGQQKSVYGVNENNDVVSVENEKNAIVWQYQLYDGYYRTAFDLYDYDIIAGETTINLKQVLESLQGQENQDIVYDTEKGFVLKAKYNAETQKYDSFALEFQATEDVSILFDNFKTATKYVNISYLFNELNNTRIEEVKYVVGSPTMYLPSADWIDMEAGQTYETQVQFADAVLFRLKTKENIVDHEFTLEKTIASESYQSPERYSIDDSNYVVFIFFISDVYFDSEIPSVKLVPTGSQV